MRALKASDRCEHITESWGREKGLAKTRCQVLHNQRVDGKPPMQLVPVKDGRAVRFMCLEHAPKYQRGMTVRRQRKGQPPEEQVSLL